MRVAVIGGGPAGLSAAWALAGSGAQVELLERDARAGGLLRTETLDGARVDVGVQLVASTHTEFARLAREAGAGALLQASPGRDALWRKGRPQPITYGSVPSMIASGALPTTLKLKMGARYLPFLKGEARHLDANDLVRSGGASFDRESIGAWGMRELGEDFVELLVYPLLAAYYGALPEETSAAVYHALALVGMDVRVVAAAGGFGAVADAIASALEGRGVRLRTGVEVKSVRLSGDDVVVDDDVFDAAILAVPANRAAALLRAGGSSSGELLAFLDGVRERSTLTLSCRLDREFPGDYFGLSFPRVSEQGRAIAALCIQRRKLDGLVPRGGDAVTVMPAPRAVPHLLAQDDETVAATLLRELEAAVPGITKRVTKTHVARFPDGYTIFEPNHILRLQQLQRERRIGLAGDYLVAPSVEGAVRSGLLASKAVTA